MGVMASQITSLTIVYSTVYSGADQRKHQSYASLAFVPVTRKIFPFEYVIMQISAKESQSNEESITLLCYDVTKNDGKCLCARYHLSYHYDDVIMTEMASQITSLTIVYLIVYSGTDQIKHQSSASLAFVWGIHRGPVNSPHKGPVTRKMFPFDDVIMMLLVYVFVGVRLICDYIPCDIHPVCVLFSYGK